MKTFISPVGTSILSNISEIRPIVTEYSNHKNSAEIPQETLDKLDNHVDVISEKIQTANLNEVKSYSAELHAIIAYYENGLNNTNDLHYLIPSDTYIGLKAAKIIQSYLHKYFYSVCMLNIKGLQTGRLEDFQYALTELTKSIIDIADGINPPNKLVFNLTGGFKSVQGFLQTMGSYYADESIYIYEKSPELLRIPKLPIKIIPNEIVSENLKTIRRIKLELPVSTQDVERIPKTLVLDCDDLYMMSAWGEIVWDNVKKTLYSKTVYRPPTDKVRYGENFEKSIARLSPDRIFNINDSFDKLAYYLEKNRKQDIKSLNFHDIGKDHICFPPSDYEFYAWSDKDAKRIYCHFNDQNQLILDTLGKHL